MRNKLNDKIKANYKSVKSKMIVFGYLNIAIKVCITCNQNYNQYIGLQFLK